jgi:hypothetical protein
MSVEGFGYIGAAVPILNVLLVESVYGFGVRPIGKGSQYLFLMYFLELGLQRFAHVDQILGKGTIEQEKRDGDDTGNEFVGVQRIKIPVKRCRGHGDDQQAVLFNLPREHTSPPYL